MIYSLNGKITDMHERFLVLECNGIGYRIFSHKRTINTFHGGEENIKFFCFHYVREDQEELFGFLDELTLSFFELLFSVQGVGPKTALGILDLDTVPNIMAAILERRVDLLSSAPGIGKKTAERIMIELQNKIKLPEASMRTKGMDINREAEEALVELGYRRDAIRQALEKIGSDAHTVEEKLKAALRELGRK